MDSKCLQVSKYLCLSLAFLIGSSCVFGQMTARKTSYGRGYLESLPASYNTGKTKYPCIIYLHGAAERGNGSAKELNLIKKYGIPSLITQGHPMCFSIGADKACFIVLMPQQSTGRWGWKGDVIPFVEYAIETYRIDQCRIYLTGVSMGGVGVWDASYDSGNLNNYFAAIAPVSASGDYHSARITAQRNIPVWAFHGSADKAVPLRDGKRAINGMKSATPAIPPIFTIYEGFSHEETYHLAYDPTHRVQKPNLYEWFLKQKKCSSGLLALLLSLVRRKKLNHPYREKSSKT